MGNDFFGADSSGESVWFQHLHWFFGYPETWLILILWAALLVAVVKLSRRLWFSGKKIWLALFVILTGTALGYYIWLLTHAFGPYVEERGAEFAVLPYARRVFLTVSLISAGWIVFDWLRARRSV